MKTIIVAICLLVQGAVLSAQDITWHTPSFIEGVCERDTNIYHRLPQRLKDSVRPVVWNLSLNTAGEFIHFRSSARSFVVHYGLAGKTLAMPHMPSTSVSGLDLYMKDKHGQWNWMPPRYRFGDTVTYTYSNIGVAAGAVVDYYLLLPLYNTVTWLSIGAKKEETLQFEPDR
jgi:hypothetical protein